MRIQRGTPSTQSSFFSWGSVPSKKGGQEAHQHKQGTKRASHTRKKWVNWTALKLRTSVHKKKKGKSKIKRQDTNILATQIMNK